VIRAKHSRSVVVNHSSLWSWKPRFESGREFHPSGRGTDVKRIFLKGGTPDGEGIPNGRDFNVYERDNGKQKRMQVDSANGNKNREVLNLRFNS
jgi:hypothetical protein